MQWRPLQTPAWVRWLRQGFCLCFPIHLIKSNGNLTFFMENSRIFLEKHPRKARLKYSLVTRNVQNEQKLSSWCSFWSCWHSLTFATSCLDFVRQQAPLSRLSWSLRIPQMSNLEGRGVHSLPAKLMELCGDSLFWRKSATVNVPRRPDFWGIHQSPFFEFLGVCMSGPEEYLA